MAVGAFPKHSLSISYTTLDNVPSDSTFSIDLTVFAKIWKDIQYGTHDSCYACAETGVLLYNFNNEGNVWLEAVEYSTGIYVTMDYAYPSEGGDFYMNNRHTKTFLTAFTYDESLEVCSGLVSEMGPNFTWNIEYEGNDLFSLHPKGQTNLYLDMYGNFATVESYQTKWTRSIAAGGGVIWTAYNGNVLAVDEDGDVVIESPALFTTEQKAWRMVQTDSYIELNPSEVSSNVIWVAPEEHINIFSNLSNSHFSQASDFIYTINSTAVTHSNGIIVGVAPNATDVVVFNHIPTGQSMSVSIRVAPLKEGNYLFQNGEPLPNMFMQIDDWDAPDYNTDGESLELRSLNCEEHQKWILTRVHNNY